MQPLTIRYTIVPCSLGRLILAATERGVCALALNDSDMLLQRFLAHECPDAKIVRDDAGLSAWAESVVGHIEGARRELEVPLDARGTPLQQRVWRELRKIPYGRTKTYTQIARAIGRPAAIRAVARACATNPVSIIVPCHRVIRVDGNLAGYRWGLNRKQAILRRETLADQPK